MLRILRHPTFAALFSAQVVALSGTGLLTVALGLLAYEIAGAQAGAVLGTALAIKMIAYVALAPLAQALASGLPRKALLVGADLVRAAMAVLLPFVTEIWQIYLLIFLLQAASASFTPAFQALIPDVLTDEEDYTRALSLSRLAYDLENLLSPLLAGLLLTVISFHGLFVGTTLGFLGSAALVVWTRLPPVAGTQARPFRQRLARGGWIYLATPRLRGLLALNLAAAAAGAFVIVNTVVLVRISYGGAEADLAWALAAFGAGSMAVALALPRMMRQVLDRRVMMSAGAVLALVSLGYGAIWLVTGPLPWAGFPVLWAVLGAAYSGVLTPSGRLLRRSAAPEDRPALFAAQFALSHLCWLLTYPLAGWAGAAIGLPATLLMLGAIAAVAVLAAGRLWPRNQSDSPAHRHPGLGPGHPHLARHGPAGSHRHPFVIDDLHPVWPHSG